MYQANHVWVLQLHENIHFSACILAWACCWLSVLDVFHDRQFASGFASSVLPHHWKHAPIHTAPEFLAHHLIPQLKHFFPDAPPARSPMMQRIAKPAESKNLTHLCALYSVRGPISSLGGLEKWVPMCLYFFREARGCKNPTWSVLPRCAWL